MNVRNRYRRPTPRTFAARRRTLHLEALEDRVLLSGVADAFGVKKIKYVEADGDKVQVKLKKDIFDITFDRDGNGDILNVDTLTLYGNNPTAILSFKVKPAKGGVSDGITIVDLIDSAGPNVSLGGLESKGAVINSINLTGTLLGGFSTSTDFGSATFGHLTSFTIQGGHDLLGTLTVESLDRFVANGGDIIGSLIVLTSLGELQADDISGTVMVGTNFDKLTLEGDLSGDVTFGKGTLDVLIGGNVTPTGSIVGNDPDNDTNIEAGGFSRLGVIGDFAGLFSADGDVGLGVGGALTSDVTAGNNLIARAGTISGNLTATTGDVSFSMNSGGFSGVITAADDVFGNGTNNGIVIRGGNFNGVINAGDEVAAMTFLPSSGGFAGTLVAGGKVNDITTNFFASTTSITGASIGNLTANRTNAGDAIAAGATFTATNGAIGNVTAQAIASIAIGGTFTAESFGDITATSNGNTSADHAISGATFLATEGAIGDVTATAKAGSGIHNSTFTATTGMGELSAASNTRHGFEATANGLNVFTVTEGSFTSITGTSVIGDGIHGGTFTAFQDIDTVTGSSVSGSGIGDGTGAVTTMFIAQEGIIGTISGSATGGAAGSAGDGIASTTAFANVLGGVGIGAIKGDSQFGTGISNSQFSAEGTIAAVSGTTNNSNPSVNEDGIFGSTFRSAADIQNIVAKTGVTGGAGVGAAVEDSIFSARGNLGGGGICDFPVSSGPLDIVETKDSDEILNRLFGGAVPGGITIDDVEIVAPADPDDSTRSAIGLYQGFPELPVGTASILPDGVILTSGLARNALGPNNTGGETTQNTGGADPDLDSLEPGADTEDAASITITFTNDSSVKSLSLLFVFASEEFAEFVNSPFNDIFGVFLDGVNISNDPNGNILNVNNNFFLINNTTQNPPTDATGQPITGTSQVSLADIQYDGLTPVLQVSTPGVLDPGTHTLKFAIADVADELLDSGVFISPICASGSPGSVGVNLASTAITATGDIVDSTFLAGYDIADFSLDGTGVDASEVAATTPVSINGIRVTGDWVNSVAAAGITSADSTFGDGDDALSAPGSDLGNVSITSNIAGVTGAPAINYFQSDRIGNVEADAIGIDPNSGSDVAAVGFNTDFSNVEDGSIGDITAITSTQRQAIGDGSTFTSGTSIGNVTAANDNTSFNDLNALGSVTFDANTSIGNITAATPFAPLGTTMVGTQFIAHDNNPETELAIGNVTVNEGLAMTIRDPVAMANVFFDATNPTVAGTALNIGTFDVVGDVGVDNLFTSATSLIAATGDIGRGVRFASPTDVTTADLNGDGNLDLVVVDTNADSVAVSFGNGDGTFQAPSFLQTGDAPVRVVVTDLTGDSALDLVVLNSVTGIDANDSLSIRINNGDGTFEGQSIIQLDTQSTPTGLAVGDWIEDGDPDLAITDITGTVTILKGLGEGEFQEAAISDLDTGDAPSSVTVTSATGAALPPPISFNGDGRIDMAVTNFDDDTISIFLGNVGQAGAGTGTWSAATDFSVGNGPVSLAIGSLDSTLNSSLDLVVANNLDNTVSVLLGTGTGVFGAASTFAVGTNPEEVSLVDVNNDGKLDIVTVNSGSDDVSVLLGNGLGGFGGATQFAVGADPVALRTADLDEDGNVDIIVANEGSGSLTVLFGEGDGTFARRNIFEDPSIIGVKVTGNIAGSSFLADFDENNSGSLAGIGGIQVLAGQGNTRLDPATFSAEGIVQGNIYGVNLFPVFQGGSNDDTSGLAVGDVTAEGGDIESEPLMATVLFGIHGTTFQTVDTFDALNIGDLTTTGGSFGAFAAPATVANATGSIGDVTSASGITSATTFTADTDLDNEGDIGSVTAGSIGDATFVANNIAVSDDDVTRAITVTSGVSDLSMTATTGSIGDFLVSMDEGNESGGGVATTIFNAAVNIGNISIRFTTTGEDPDPDVIEQLGSVLDGSTFIAGTVDPTGSIGNMFFENIIEQNDSDVVAGATFLAGTDGIGNITVITNGQGAGIVDSSFRTTGATSVDHKGNIGNITVETTDLPGDETNDAVRNSVFSAIGSIGNGAGNEDGFHIDLIGSAIGSRFLAGFDIGEDLLAGTGDDLLSSAVTFINKIVIEGRFIASDLAAGVDPNTGSFGDSDDIAAVVGSSLGSIEIEGVSDAEADPGLGGFVPENPIADRLHGIVADLIGSILIDGEQQVANLPGFIDNGGGANDVNVRVL